jgi:uncharacterized protein
MEYSAEISRELKLDARFVTATIQLLDDDATVPFIARYRKEVTGGMDEVQIADIRDRNQYLHKLEDRKKVILKSIKDQGKLTDELKEKIEAVREATVLEDLYLPYRPKRKTRATVAIAKGLEPLADMIWAQEAIEGDVQALATPFIDDEKEVPDADAAWAGARDIVAERVSETAPLRASLREFFLARGGVVAKIKKGKDKAGANFRDYFDFAESTKRIPSHRMLAIRRGESEGFLSLRILVDRDQALAIVREAILKEGGGTLKEHLLAACEDGYDRLLTTSIEGYARNELRKRADDEAISVFVTNLRGLLMASPLGGKWVLAIDPGIRTGCKIVALDDKGDLLAHTVIFPIGSQQEKDKAAARIVDYCSRYRIQAIAIGNGTGGRETEGFLRKLERDQINDADIVMVNEAGASIYSASEIARKEFPDHDLTVRGAISIGRRLQDPLAELVKIDAKSIGVGQYQHDVDQDRLKNSLDDTVVSSVNAVGVELNTASEALLSYVSGLNTTQAHNIIAFRSESGHFKTRKQLLKVPRLGPKAFEQAAGFLRIRLSEHPLDRSAVHPERYDLVQQMATDLDSNITDLIDSAELRGKIDLKKYITDEVGEPTLRDILAELEKPGRDPRPPLEPVRFNPDVTEIKDLEPGMKLDGVVSNVTNFGAFVDIGVHQDGLVHVSELSHTYVEDASKVVTVEQRVKVVVLEVDRDRKRISLSIKQTSAPPPRPKQQPSSRPPRPQNRQGPPPRQNARQSNNRQSGGGPPKYNPFAALSMKGGKVSLDDNSKSNKKKSKKK